MQFAIVANGDSRAICVGGFLWRAHCLLRARDFFAVRVLPMHLLLAQTISELFQLEKVSKTSQQTSKRLPISNAICAQTNKSTF